MGLSPTFGNHTPPIAGLQTRKAKLGSRRDQVIADASLVLQEFRGNHCADQMGGLIRSGAAAAIAIEARDRIRAAGLQLCTKDIRLILHTSSVTLHSPGNSSGAMALPVSRDSRAPALRGGAGCGGFRES
jgi:hypothetical protein